MRSRNDLKDKFTGGGARFAGSSLRSSIHPMRVDQTRSVQMVMMMSTMMFRRIVGWYVVASMARLKIDLKGERKVHR